MAGKDNGKDCSVGTQDLIGKVGHQLCWLILNQLSSCGLGLSTLSRLAHDAASAKNPHSTAKSPLVDCAAGLIVQAPTPRYYGGTGELGDLDAHSLRNAISTVHLIASK